MKESKSHIELSDDQFELAFERCELTPSSFTHEAHLRIAWIHVTKYGVERAIENVCHQLLNFVDHVGARDKFNKTLTIAAVRAVSHFIRRGNDDNFSDFIMHWPRLKYNFKELMACHYQKDIFNSLQAKIEYLEPDLLPFDQ